MDIRAHITDNRIKVTVITVFGLLYSLISFFNHYNFRTYAFDLGIFNNTIWDYAHFRWNDNTVMQPAFENILSDHFSLLPLLVSPLLWLFGSYTMLVIQIAGLLFGGLGIYRLVHEMTSERKLALIAMVHFYSMWGIYSALGFDYHDNVMAASFLPWFIYCFRTKQWKIMILYFILILISKENMALWMIFICMGLSIQYFREKKRLFLSGLLALISATYFILVVKFIIPSLANEGRQYLHFHYSALGENFGAAIRFMLLHPLDTFMLLFKEPSGAGAADKILLHCAILFSGGMLLIMRPQYLIMLLPIYAQKLFNDDVGKWGISYHYCIEFAPVIVVAVYDFVSALKSDKIKYIVACTCMASTVLTTHIIIGRFMGVWQDKLNVQYYKKAHYVNKDFDIHEVHKVLAMIPDTAAVSAQSNLVPRLAFRDRIYAYPEILDAEYIMLLPAIDGTYPLSREEYDRRKTALIESDETEKIYNSESVILLRMKK